jgi:cyclic beta-1,2-glucan synthetase
MMYLRLSGKMGAALDPCATIRVPFELANGHERELSFRLGIGNDTEDAVSLEHRFRGSVAAHGVLETVWRYWNQTIGFVQ